MIMTTGKTGDRGPGAPGGARREWMSGRTAGLVIATAALFRSEEHTSELQSLS